MNTCVNTEAGEFRVLKERSGLPDFLLEVLVAKFQDEHNGAWPHLDELPVKWVDTKKALDQFLGLDANHNSMSQQDLLTKTGTQTLQEAKIFLNDVYRNLNVDFYTVNDKVVFTTDGRPSPFDVVENEAVDLSSLASTVYINQSLQELESKMGIQTHLTSSAELEKNGLTQLIPEASTAAAFIYQGEIYVNQDIADVDAKAHELMHVLLGSIKFKQPELYANLVSSVESLEGYGDLITRYPNRTRLDVNEEIFVREYARMLTGLSSQLSQLDENIIYNLNYEMSRVLDTMLDGDNSVRVISVKDRLEKTFRELGEIVNSHNMENSLQEYMDLALMHRILANKKEDLMKNGTLREDCD